VWGGAPGPGAKPLFRGSEGLRLSEADIFLFQRLISSLKIRLSHKFGKFRLHGERVNMSAPAYNGQSL